MADSASVTPSPLEAVQAALLEARTAAEVAQAAQVYAENRARAATALSDALTIAEIRYRRLFESSRDGILIIDAETGKIIDANPFMAELLGYQRPEFLDKELWEIGMLKDKQASRIAFQQLEKEGYIRYENLPLETRFGERREVEFVSNLYSEGNHEVIQCNVRDNTEHNRKENEASAARERHLTEALERADHDPLTGLLNHRSYYRRLEEETARATREGTSLMVAVLDIDNFKFFNDVYGHLMGDQVLRTVAVRLQSICRDGDQVARFGGDEFALVLGGIGTKTHGETATWLREQMGDLTFLPEGQQWAIPITLSVGVALFMGGVSERIQVLELADARLLYAKTGGVVDGEVESIRTAVIDAVEGFSLLDALVTAVDNKDRYTRRHSEDVLHYSLMIARELGMSQAEQHTISVAALLHDVGKIGVPDAVLRKPGPLNDEEFHVVKQHPQMGAIIVAAIPGLEDTVDAVRSHHERWDGKGYPFGLRAEETPLIARLMAVADAFSAITTDRPYRKGFAKGEARMILESGAGTQWDPLCVGAFLRAHG